jgi:hypothetical protein
LARLVKNLSCSSAVLLKRLMRNRSQHTSSLAMLCTMHCALVFFIERGRYWQAEYWISGVRDYALSLACHRRGLPASNGRGFDELPSDVLGAFSGSLVFSLEPAELLRALGIVIDGLLSEADELGEPAAKVEPQLRELTLAWD